MLTVDAAREPDAHVARRIANGIAAIGKNLLSVAGHDFSTIPPHLATGVFGHDVGHGAAAHIAIVFDAPDGLAGACIAQGGTILACLET